MNYRVTKDRGCLAPGGAYYKPLCEIDQALFKPEGIQALIEAGFLESFEPAPSAPAPEGRTGLVSPSKWSLDPADLQDKGLDELNVMILEREEDLEQFETIEEARAWLTQDYQPVGV